MRSICLPYYTNFKCYVYASHASDVYTRKSITGYIHFMISGDPVSWQRRIQTSVALSIGIHGCMWRDTRSHVTSSITWENWFAHRNSILMITDHPGDHRALNMVILAKNLLVMHPTSKGTIELGFFPTAEQTTGWWLTKSPTIPYLLSH